MPFDEVDIEITRTIRSARSPMQGSILGSAGGRDTSHEARISTVVDDTDHVRRLWTPGDPWTSDYFFGGGTI